jgi:RecB family exonuclease
MENLLYWREAGEAEPQGRIDAASFGSLAHEVIEQFYREHGPAFGARKRTLAAWQADVVAFIDRGFDSFARGYPFVSDATANQELQRLRRTVATFLDYDWNDGRPRQFAVVEQPFGDPTPLRVVTEDGPLYLHGFIDRIDVEGGTTLLRDIKTGQASPRASGDAPEALTDLQLGIYVAALRAHATDWGLPKRVEAAYAHTVTTVHKERAYRDDIAALEDVTGRALTVAHQLLDEAQFPRTPDASDCKWCPFKRVCGDSATERADEALEDATGAAAAFRDLKREGMA